jgi:PAS domain S-box-containing protein/putative nucleotidyltransferase with HDIG domain
MNSVFKGTESHFKNLVERANIGIFTDDKEGNFTYVNKKYAEMLGYSQNEIKKQNIQSIVHPDDRERVYHHRKACLKGKGTHSRYQLKGIKKDGSLIFLEVDTSALKKGRSIIGTHSYIWDITKRKKLEDKHEHMHAKFQVALRGFVLAMAKSVEERDPFTSDHQQRVADLASAIAEEMNLSVKKTDGIHLAGIIHDIGKIKVPAEILSKSAKLTETEFEIVKTHPSVGYEILKNIEFPWPIAQIVYQHHERIDGSGYPQGLMGDSILLESKILAVADVAEAMCSHRPFRAALGINAAIEEISQNSGRLYDPKVVDACLKLLKEKKYRFKSETRDVPPPHRSRKGGKNAF